MRGRVPSSAAFSDASRNASRASAALRPMAAAGLFSSWARPAAMVPSEISFPCCCETDASEASRTSDLPQVLVDELDGDCALADGRGAALDRAVTHVPSDEDAWYAVSSRNGSLSGRQPLGRLPLASDPVPRG